ncbi:MAG: peptidase C1, partial [Legionella sp.]
MVDTNSMMSLEEFHQISEDVTEKVLWSPILNVYQSVLEQTDTNKTLDQIKAALNEKDRVTFGVFLFDLDLGFMGAVGTHKSTYDTWTLTPVIMRDLHLSQAMGAHEMIITGYDDDAITTDEEGNQYKGLLTLRNSWSEKYGDKGDFYMTYDFFKALVMEAQRIRTLPDTVVEDLNPTIG